MKRLLLLPLLLLFACEKEDSTSDQQDGFTQLPIGIYTAHGKRDSSFTLVDNSIYRLSLNDQSTMQVSVDAQAIAIGRPTITPNSISVQNESSAYPDTLIFFNIIYESSSHLYLGRGAPKPFTFQSDTAIVATDTIPVGAIQQTYQEVFAFEKFGF